MAAACHAKIRYVERRDAEDHAVVLPRLIGKPRPEAYFCTVHFCWHVGHRVKEYYRPDRSFLTETIGRLAQQRQSLIQDYGRTRDRRHWTGVQILSRAMAHLRAHRG